MEVTKDLVLESMNTYCTERKYGSEALTDGFKEKFSNFFVKRYEGKDVSEDDMKSDLHFNLDTAFSSSVDLKTLLQSQFSSKETEYKNQIAELNKKLGSSQQQQQQVEFQIPQELQEQLDELKRFKTEESRKAKFNEIVTLAKKNVREDCISDFDIFVKDYEVKDDVSAEEQAKKLHSRFQEIFKSKIGDITPLAPRQTAQVEKEMLETVTKIEL